MTNDLTKITREIESPKDLQIAKIEDDLQGERDSRNRERFYWVFGIIVLLDVIAFRDMSAIGTVFVFVLEIVFLTVMGRNCGFHDIYTLTQNLLDRLNVKFTPPKDQ